MAFSNSYLEIPFGSFLFSFFRQKESVNADIKELLFSGTYNKYPYQEKPPNFYNMSRSVELNCGLKKYTRATFYMRGSEKDNIYNYPSSYCYILLYYYFFNFVERE